MSLTGNMELSELQQRKVQWKTLDDEKHQCKAISYDIN
jgi:hypothetical protein